jgi:hypothetical protein
MLELRPNCECCDKDLPPAANRARRRYTARAEKLLLERYTAPAGPIGAAVDHLALIGSAMLPKLTGGEGRLRAMNGLMQCSKTQG